MSQDKDMLQLVGTGVHVCILRIFFLSVFIVFIGVNAQCTYVRIRHVWPINIYRMWVLKYVYMYELLELQPLPS